MPDGIDLKPDRINPMRATLVPIGLALLLVVPCLVLSEARQVPWWDAGLSAQELDHLAGMTDHFVLSQHLPPFFEAPRPPGTPAIEKVRKHIKDFFGTLPQPWHFEEDRFTAPTPIGDIEFVNLVYTFNVNATKRLMLSAHYDSKYFAPDNKFFGATDSAVPCAMLMDVALKLGPYLSSARTDYSLQIVFFDGEEAFREWTDSDSLYGSRHLAELWAQRDADAAALLQQNSSAVLPVNRLNQIDLMVLFDLLGAPKPVIMNMDNKVSFAFKIFTRLERRLRLRGHLPIKVDPGQYKEYLAHTESPQEQPYFDQHSIDVLGPSIQDDHIPFTRRGVRAMDIIPVPFPDVWHTNQDDQAHVSPGVILNWCLIARAFVVEYLGIVLAIKDNSAARDEL